MERATIQYPPEPMTPACHITASDDELRMLGELCAIQGQIEFTMQWTVSILRGVSLPKARKLLSSPNMTANANIWLSDVEKSPSREIIKNLARTVAREIDVIRKGRNDFVHALYAYDEGGGAFSFKRDRGQNSSPRRDKPGVAVHNLMKVPMSNLKEVRDKAAVISRFVWFVYQESAGPTALKFAGKGQWRRCPAPFG